MKRLHLLFCIFLVGMLSCQEEIQKENIVNDFENFEKSLPPGMLTDTSFLAFKDHFLYLRDYPGPFPDSTDMAGFLNCIQQHIQADSANIHTQIDSRTEFVSFMLGFGDLIPDIIYDCNLDDDLAGNYLRPIYHMQSRLLDLSSRYEELQNDPEPWTALIAELNLPAVTPEYWSNNQN